MNPHLELREPTKGEKVWVKGRFTWSGTSLCELSNDVDQTLAAQMAGKI